MEYPTVYDITRFEADYFLFSENFNYYEYKNWIVDLSKCQFFSNKKELNKYFTKLNYEKVNIYKKNERIRLKEKIENQNELLGKAMIDFNLKREKEKQLRKEKQEIEETKNNLIRDAHGFDEQSFKTYPPKEVKN